MGTTPATTTTTKDPKIVGQWEPEIKLLNIPIHATLLPNRKILYWGRTSNPMTPDHNLHEQTTRAFILDLDTWKDAPTKTIPKDFVTGKEVNLFCSGHTLLPDGRLLVAGGHLNDGVGIKQACLYDWTNDAWLPQKQMDKGRWYPSCKTLPDGSAIVVSGSYWDDAKGDCAPNNTPEIFRGDGAGFSPLPTTPPDQLFPQLFLDGKGGVFKAGPGPQSMSLSATRAAAAWINKGKPRSAGQREQAPCVMYDDGKIMYIGGGNAVNDGPPTNEVQFINLNDPDPQWTNPSTLTNMGVPRRQHNATLLPDGTVLVTGGTRGPGFNNVQDSKAPVHEAELYNPSASPPGWTTMAAESWDRCYHSTALLLPDGRVFSAGGGEWADGKHSNDTKYNNLNAQLFKPPYFFKGQSPSVGPTVSGAPKSINYNTKIRVTVLPSDKILKVTWMRLGSVTHCTNMDQSWIELKGVTRNGNQIAIDGPTNPNITPPGHYMLFLLNEVGMPGVAPIIQLQLGSSSAAPSGRMAAPDVQLAADSMQLIATPENAGLSAVEHDEKIIADEIRPVVAVGLTPVCPYGLGACWSGAFHALQEISDVDIVRPVPDHSNSIAFVYLKQDTLPDIDRWRKEFAGLANGTYDMRGIELTLTGTVAKTGEQLILNGTSTRSEVVLSPFQTSSNVKYDRLEGAPRSSTDAEENAYAELSAALANELEGTTVKIIGTLQKHDAEKYSLHVREFQVADE